MKYNKLVRDKIPNILIKQNKKFIAHSIESASKKEKLDYLIDKLTEETNEFIGALKAIKNLNCNYVSAEEIISISDEYADVNDVLNAIYELFNGEIRYTENKLQKHGRFSDFIILDEIEDE